MAETRIGTLNFPDHTKNDTFRAVDFAVSGTNLTGATIRMDMRIGSTRFIRWDNGANGGIEITNAATGQFRFTQKVIALDAGVYNYDIEIAIAGVVDTYIGGTWTIVQDVTYGA